MDPVVSFYKAIPDLARETWGYIDPHGLVHDGFHASQIIKWMDKGFFDQSTQFRTLTFNGDCLEGPWIPLSKIIDLMRSAVERDDSPPPHSMPAQQQQRKDTVSSVRSSGVPPRPATFDSSHEKPTQRSSEDAREGSYVKRPPEPEPKEKSSTVASSNIGYGAVINMTIDAAEKRRMEKERLTNERFGVVSSSPPAVKRVTLINEKRQDTPIPGFKTASRVAEIDRFMFDSSERAPLPPSLPLPPSSAASSKIGYGAVINITIDAAEKRRTEKERLANERFGVVTPVPTSKPPLAEKRGKPSASPLSALPSFITQGDPSPSTLFFLSHNPYNVLSQQHHEPNVMAPPKHQAMLAPKLDDVIKSEYGEKEWEQKENVNVSSPHGNHLFGSIPQCSKPITMLDRIRSAVSPHLTPELSRQSSLAHSHHKGSNQQPQGAIKRLPSVDSLEERLFFAGLPHDLSPWWWYSYKTHSGQVVLKGPFPAEEISHHMTPSLRSFGVKLVGMDPSLDLRFPPPGAFFKSIDDLEKLCSMECGSNDDLSLLGDTCYQPFSARDSRRVNDEGVSEPDPQWNMPTIPPQPCSQPEKKFVYSNAQLLAMKLGKSS
jgi:hypothetical protein